jgi:hypothetical protein
MDFTAIDVGLTHMCIGKMRSGHIVDQALSSILITKDGRCFEYQEGQVEILCWEWVNTVKDFWQGSSLIYIEPQISFHGGKERACLMISCSLYSIFLTLFQLGLGPKPVRKVASWWKKEMGIQVGGHEASDDNHHKTNKDRSISHYFENDPNAVEEIQRLKQIWGPKIDDFIDNKWMLRALQKNHLGLIGPHFMSHHIEAPNTTRVKASDRHMPLPTLSSHHPATTGGGGGRVYSPIELRRMHLDFMERRKKAVKLRENTRLLKRIKR